MQPIAGQPMLWHVLTRAKLIADAQVVLATTVHERDTPLAELANDLGLPFYRGDEADVLGRFEAVADRFNPDVVMRITGDCPLLDPAIARRVLAAFADGVDYVTNDTTQSGYPDGTDVEVFSRDALRRTQLAVPRIMPTIDPSVPRERANGEALRRRDAQQDREHVTPWMRRRLPWRLVMNPDLDQAAEIGAITQVKLSVDTEEDLDRVRGIVGFLPEGATSLAETIGATRKFFERVTTVQQKVGKAAGRV